MREAKEAVFNTEARLEVDQTLVDYLKQRARDEPRRRFRLCLHHSTADPVQDMMIVFCRHAYTCPHRFTDRAICYHMVEGDLTVFLFDDAGRLTRAVEMASPQSGKTFCLHLSSGQWHLAMATTEVAVVRETLPGPNLAGEAIEWATWAPGEENTEAVLAFIERLGIKLSDA